MPWLIGLPVALLHSRNDNGLAIHTSFESVMVSLARDFVWRQLVSLMFSILPFGGPAPYRSCLFLGEVPCSVFCPPHFGDQ